MKKKQKNPIILLSLLMVGGMTLSGCMDSNYDLGDLDKTLALGSGTLQLPVNNSLKDILLDDILNLDDTESVTKDADGYYHYGQNSTIDDVSEIKIEIITVAKESSQDIPAKIEINTPAGFDALPNGTPITQIFEGTLTHSINTFNYNGDQPQEVFELQSTNIDGTVNLTVNFDGTLVGQSSDLPKLIQKFDQLSIEFPAYLEIESNYTQQGNKLIFTDVPTSQNLVVTVKLKKANFNVAPEGNNKLAVENGKVIMEGGVKIEASYKTVAFNKGDIDLDKLTINSTTAISDIVINAATGKFNPSIDVTDSEIELNDLPDFLTNEKVVVDLYNPQIILNANSDLPLKGFVNAKLIAVKNNQTIKTVVIPEFSIKPGINKVCISRRDEAIPSDITEKVIVPELSEIISQVPDVIKLEIDARADKDQVYTFELGHNYSLTGINYSILAPLAFGENAKIVYSDTEDGWAEDMPEDLDFEKDGYIEMTAIVESNVPAYLTVSAKAINANKDEIDNVTVDVDNVIKASADGSLVATPMRVILKEKNQKGALKQVDGVSFTLEASSKDENGQSPIIGKPLNATQNKLVVHDVKVTIHGRVIADLN